MTDEEFSRFKEAKIIRDGAIDYKSLPIKQIPKVKTSNTRTQKEVTKLIYFRDVINSFIPEEFLDRFPRLNCVSKRSRKKELVNLRHIFAKIAMDNDFGCKSIGIVIYRNQHDCCFNGREKANNYIKYDPEFKELYLKILNKYHGSRVNEHAYSEQNIS